MYAVEICQKKPEGHKYRSEHVPERGVGSDERVVQVRQRARVLQRVIPLCQIQLIKNRVREELLELITGGVLRRARFSDCFAQRQVLGGMGRLRFVRTDDKEDCNRR